MIDLGFRPRADFSASPTLWRFLRDTAFVTGVLGPLGSGKSYACCIKLMMMAMQQAPSPIDNVRRTKWAVIRNTYPELRTTTLPTWLEIFPEAHCGNVRYSHPISHRIERAPRGAEPGLDVEVLFLALDSPTDVKHLKSLDITGAWINEAVELPEGVIDMLTGRVGRFPPPADVPATWAGIIMDTNAPDDQSWWYRYAEKGEGVPKNFDIGVPGLDLSWRFYRQPSAVFEVEPEGARFRIAEPGVEPVEVEAKHCMPSAGRWWWVNPKAENLKYLRAGYYHQQLQRKTLEWINRYMQAKYIYLTDGKPWVPEFSDQVMSRPINADRALPLVGGIDAGGGTLNPAAVIGQRGPLGDWRVLYELTITDIGIERFSLLLQQDIARYFPGFAAPRFWIDPAGRGRDEIYETAVEEHLRARGFDAHLAPSNDPVTRRSALALPMGRLMVVNGRSIPGFLVNSGTDVLPGCSTLRAALAGKWKRRVMWSAAREPRIAERPEKNEWSHVGDAASYMTLGGGEHVALIRPPQGDRQYAQPVVHARTAFNPFTNEVI